MSKEPRTHDDGRNERQRQRDEEKNQGRQGTTRTGPMSKEDDPNRLAGRPDDAQLREDATERQRIAYEKDEPGFVERMAEERQRPDFIERTLPEDPSDHYGQLTRDNVNPDIPSSKKREGWIADPHTLGMDQSQQGEPPPEREDQVEQWPQAQKLPASGEYQKGDDLQQQHEVDPNAPIPPKPREASINEPPGSNVLPGMDTGPIQPPEGAALPELTLTDIDPDSAEVGSMTDFTLTVTGSGFGPNCVILFDDEELPTTLVNSTTLTAAPPAATEAGTVDVEVARGEDLSDVLTFEWVAPAGTRSSQKGARKPKKAEPPSRRTKKGKGKR